jgi:hypothetical protein
MKKIYSVLFFLLFISQLDAQVVLHMDDMPGENDDFLVSNALDFTFDSEETGEDYTWDYTYLTSLSQDTILFHDVSDAPFIYQFVFNNPFDPANQATESQDMDDFSLIPQLDIADMLLFTKNTSSKLEELGVGITFNGLPAPIQYENKKTVYAFPLAYGDSTGDNYAYSMDVPGLGYAGEVGTRSYEVDGWGELTTSFGTFEAIRLRIEHNYEDSIYIDSSEFGLTIPRSLVIYEWLAEGTGIPLLTYTTEFGIVTSVVYQDNLILTDVAELSDGIESFNLYPQPASEYVVIELDRYPSKELEVSIFDLSGKKVFSDHYQSKKSTRISTSLLTPGLYMLEVKVDDFSKVEKLIIR